MILDFNWLTDKHIDFEYKKYLLLNYFQKVDLRFNENKLYPFFKELKAHYQNLVALKQEKKNMRDLFPGRVQGIDWENLELLYEKLLEDDDLLQELEAILDFSIPKFESYVQEGKYISRFVREKLHLFPIGIEPLYRKEGYLVLKNGTNKDVRIFQYTSSLYQSSGDKYQHLKTQYITTCTLNTGETIDHIKRNLIRQKPEMPNPATYVAESELVLPLRETLLPVAEYTLAKYVTTSQAN